MRQAPQPWTAAAVLDCVAAADLEHRLAHPLGAGVLLLDLASTRALGPRSAEELAVWLPRLPCPVIGFGDGDIAFAGQLDTRVATLAAAAALATRVLRWPGAALVLVQTLRAIENLPLERALDIESMAYATLQGGSEHRAWLVARERVAPRHGDGTRPLLLSRSGTTLKITLDRPQFRNAISVDMRDALVEALQLVAADTTIERAVLCANGSCFSVGGDLAEFGTMSDTLTPHLVRNARLPARWLARTAPRIEARLHGACIGAGIELPAFASLVRAREDAWFQLPELAMGLIPGAGGCVSIARRIGRQRTVWMVLSGRRVNASSALAWGLIDEIGDAP